MELTSKGSKKAATQHKQRIIVKVSKGLPKKKKKPNNIE
jgi:hypothetical protein